MLNGNGLNGGPVVRDDIFAAVADVDGGFEDNDVLAGNLGSLHATDQFFGLAREHRSAYNLDTARPLIVYVAFDVHKIILNLMKSCVYNKIKIPYRLDCRWFSSWLSAR